MEMGKRNPALPAPEPADTAAPSLVSSQTSPRNPACAENQLGICAMCAGRRRWGGEITDSSSVLRKAQLPTASRAFALSKVLSSGSIKLPLMGLSAPSRSKEGLAAPSCFKCTASLNMLVSHMCSSHLC